MRSSVRWGRDATSSCGSPGSRAAIHASTRCPRCSRPPRRTPSTRKPAFSAARREAQLPTSAVHSIREASSTAKAQRQAAPSASGTTPWPRAAGRHQKPTSHVPGVPVGRRDTSASTSEVVLSQTAQVRS